MKFIRTKITIEKLSETILRQEPASCPNCGHSLTGNLGYDNQAIRPLGPAAAIEMANIKLEEKRENDNA